MLAIIVSIASVTFAIGIFLVQEYRRRASERETRQWRSQFDKLEEQRRTAAWELWGSAEFIWRKAEKLKERLDQRTVTGVRLEEEISPDQVKAEVGVLYGLAAANARLSILQIKAAEPSFSMQTIALWRNQGKIANHYQEQLFRKITTDDSLGIDFAPGR